MDYKLISALVGAGYDNATIDKIMTAVQQVPPVQQVQQVPQVQQVQQVPQDQQAPVQQVPVQQVQQAPVPQVTVPQAPQVPVQQMPQGQAPQVPQTDVNADLSRRMLALMRDMQTAAGFSGNLNNDSNPTKSAEEVSLDILNAGGGN